MRVLLAGALTSVALGIAPPVSEAAHHLVRIREVYPGNTTTPGAEFIELQLTSTGENAFTAATTSVKFYGANAATVTGTYTFTTNPPNGQNQRTVLLGTPASETLFGVDNDYDLPAGAYLDPAAGAACFTSSAFGILDCVSWGTFTGNPGSPTGTAAAAIPNGNSLERSIGALCATKFTLADDTDNSATDFANQPVPSPRNNATNPTETGCFLTVAKSGAGTGSVTGTGISCGATCSAEYVNADTVELTATGTNGSTFNSWAVCPGTVAGNKCTVSMQLSRSVEASFDPPVGGLPPETVINARPAESSTDTTPTWSFSSPSAGVTGFECKLDGAAFAACSSPKTFTVAAGSHTFSVRALATPGGADLSPATDTFTVTKPVVKKKKKHKKKKHKKKKKKK